MRDGVLLYVIVVESDGHCGLPKGHREPGETEKETGLQARLLPGFCTRIEYPLKNGSLKQTPILPPSAATFPCTQTPRRCRAPGTFPMRRCS